MYSTFTDFFSVNILFVYNTEFSASQGGTERVARCVAKALQQKGNIVYFLTFSYDSPIALSPEHFYVSRQLPHNEQISRVYELCKKYHIDVLINEGGDFDDFSVLSNEALPGIKVITCLHFDVSDTIRGLPQIVSTHPLKRAILKCLLALGINLSSIKRYIWIRRRFRKMLCVSDAVVVVTPIIAEQLKRLTRIHPEKITSILNPLPFENESPSYDSHAKSKTLLYAGRLAKEKNVDKILGAWLRIAPEFPEWNLEIAGNGYLRDSLLELIACKSIPRVHMHGHVNHLVPLYKKAEYLLLASRCESFACVVLEGLFHGCYPIVFDYPSAQILIPNERLGFRIKKQSTENLAKAISAAIRTKTSNKDNISEIAHHLGNFDIRKLGNEWQALLEGIHNA